jgi:hypothetical protein
VNITFTGIDILYLARYQQISVVKLVDGLGVKKNVLFNIIYGYKNCYPLMQERLNRYWKKQRFTFSDLMAIYELEEKNGNRVTNYKRK